jgi:hypothetical protein
MSLIALVNVDVLFAVEASIVDAETVALLMIGPAVAPAPTVKVAVIVRISPDRSVPRLQGKAVVQAPELETNVSPAGVGSLTTTACASAGPAFATDSTYKMVLPGRAEASPIFVIDRSADGGITPVVVVATLSVGS